MDNHLAIENMNDQTIDTYTTLATSWILTVAARESCQRMYTTKYYVYYVPTSSTQGNIEDLGRIK